MIIKLESLLPGETVLETLLRRGKVMDYQCKDGYCGSCRIRVRGVVKYKKKPMASIIGDEIIACCAIAMTDLYVFDKE